MRVFDAAQYLLEKQGPLSSFRLQRILYWVLAWSLVWDGEPMFEEEIEAWASGPVFPDLYAKHKGSYTADTSTFGGDSSLLTEDNKDTVDKVFAHYGAFPVYSLSDIAMRETPWLNARKGVPVMERSTRKISLADMLDYYSEL